MEGQVVVIARGYTYPQVKNICQVLTYSKKIKNIEIALNTQNAYEILEKIIKDFKDQLHIGAGTVLNRNQLERVIQLGVEFVLSPVTMTYEMIHLCHIHHVIAIPGAYSPSEIFEQKCLGADIIKVFPVNQMSKDYAKKILEPLGNISLMAVGGVNKENVQSYFNEGYQYVGTLGGIFDKEDIIECHFENMLKSLRQFESMLK